MNLKTERNLEAFFGMIGVRNVQIQPCIELAENAVRIFVEVCNDRIVLTVAISVDEASRATALAALIGRWSIDRTYGVPLRVFAASGYLFVSSALPEDCDAIIWLRTFRVLRRLVDSYERGDE